MAKITLHGNEINTIGTLPAVGTTLADFTLANGKLEDVNLSSFSGKKVLNIFPSIDTPVCQLSVRHFNEDVASKDDVTVLCISADLPFALGRFCGAEGLENVVNLSSFRSTFSADLGVEISDGPLRGLCSRAVIVLDENNVVTHAEQIPEIAQEPDYDAALKAL